MLFSRSRLTRRGSRRTLSAVLALIYFWAFVALGLTHTHRAAGSATRPASPDRALAAAQAWTFGPAAAASSDDSTCAICDAVHAATVALAQPPAPAEPLLPSRRLAAWYSTFAPARTPRASHSRAPPQI